MVSAAILFMNWDDNNMEIYFDNAASTKPTKLAAEAWAADITTAVGTSRLPLLGCLILKRKAMIAI